VHLEVPGSACAKSRSAGNKSGSSSNCSRAVREKHLLSEFYRCAWDAAGAPGMLQVRLEIIATINRATIVKIHVLRLYSHLFIYVSMNLCIYIVTHLHTIYLDWLQVVHESNSRCT